MSYKISILLTLCSYLVAENVTIMNQGISSEFANKYLKIDKDLNRSIAENIKELEVRKISDINESILKQDNYRIDDKELKNILNSDRYLNNKEAKNISEIFNSNTMKRRLEAQKQYILKDINISDEKIILPNQISKELKHPYSNFNGTSVNLNHTQNKNNFTNQEHLFIVISSTIPKNTLQEYFKRLENKQGVTFVLRGFINGMKKIAPTREYILDITRKNNYNNDVYKVDIQINPKITKYYKIDKVPAFIFTKNKNETLMNELQTQIDKNETFYVVYGVASIDYIVEKINELANSVWLQDLLSYSSSKNK